MGTSSDLFDLSGRTALITGGGGSLGGAIGLGLSQAGARVIVIDIILTNAQKVADNIKANGGDAYAFAADLSTEPVVEEIFAKIDEVGPVNIV